MLGRLAYEISSGLTAGVNISYDEALETRVSADLKVRFGGAASTAQRKDVQQLPVINALTSTPMNRTVRVHDSVDNPFCVDRKTREIIEPDTGLSFEQMIDKINKREYSFEIASQTFGVVIGALSLGCEGKGGNANFSLIDFKDIK